MVLAGLLDKIIDEGRRFASAADLKIADMSANTPVGTTLAILERTLKVMSAVQARIHYSLKQELNLLRDIIRDYTSEDYTYDPVDGSPRAKQSDYDCCCVIPVSDPNAATMSQKVVQYQAVLQLAQQAPQIYNLPQLHRQMLDVLGIQDPQKLVPIEDDEKPKDPMTENMNILKMKPVKAFIEQDHQAHIMAHQAFQNDPLVMQTVGQNPQAQAMLASMQAHIAEHLGFAYRAQLEQMLGMPLPTPDDEEPLPMDMQNEIARMVAQGTQALAAQHGQQVQAQQAAQQAQDPLIQLQQQELAIKAQDIQRKAAKDQIDAQLKASQQQIERDRIMSQVGMEQQKLQAKMRADDLEMEAEGLKFATQRQHDRDKLEAEGMKAALKGK
jgi:ribosomal protein S24E